MTENANFGQRSGNGVQTVIKRNMNVEEKKQQKNESDQVSRGKKEIIST